MANYELIFVVEGVREDLEERLLEAGINLATIGRLQRVYVDAPGESFLEALRAGHRQLRSLKIWPTRLHLDLVNQADIADRVGISQAAVAKWVKSNNGHDRFPVEHDSSSTGPLWVWSEVNEWIRRNRKGRFDGFCSPNRRQVEEANRWIEQERESQATAPLVNQTWVEFGWGQELKLAFMDTVGNLHQKELV